MFETYVPQRFCREYVELKGHSGQLVNFMATVLGHKPLMDDWIERSKLDRYRDVCKQYGAHLEAESLFMPVGRERVPKDIVGGSSLTTTTAFGAPTDANGAAGHVHVFISRDPSILRHGMWYPIIIRNRVIWPPRADLLSYGRYLGYPQCCIAFFRKYNNWTKYSFLYEILRRSTRLHPWCNPLGKDITYSYIYHMPCSFHCEATIEMVRALRAAIAEREPDFVDALDWHLSLPTLVFRERKIYFFEGTANGQRIHYTNARFDGLDADILGPYLGEGDSVEAEGQMVRVRKGDEILFEVPCTSTGFAPEIPFIVKFPALCGADKATISRGV